MRYFLSIYLLLSAIRNVLGFFKIYRNNIFIISLNSEKIPSTSNKIGGIYQFKGNKVNVNSNTNKNQPPPELAELLGIKQKKTSRKPSKPNKDPISNDNKKKPFKSKIVIEGTVDELEKQVLSKYGSNTYKLNAEEDWDEDEIDEVKPSPSKSKFQGFEPSKQFYKIPTQTNDNTKVRSNQIEEDEVDNDNNNDSLDALMQTIKIQKKLSFKDRILQKKSLIDTSEDSNDTIINKTNAQSFMEEDYELDDMKYEEKEDDDDNTWDEEDLQYLFDKSDSNIFATSKKKSIKDKSSIIDKEITASVVNRSGPLHVISGFRLRPPPPIDPAVKMKADAKAAMIAEKEDIKKLKRAAKFEESKSQFSPFEFIVKDNSSSLLDENSNSFFTSQSFKDLGIKEVTVLRNLERMKLYNPTHIQSLAIPKMLQGKHVVLQAQTGSGKTLAFLLPLLNIIDPTKKQVQALIMAPSRELVTQIGHVATSLFKDTDYRVVTLIGGANVRNQIKQLRENRPQIIIATPGRLAEIVFRLEKIRLGMVRALVIDEVDNMMQDPYVGEIETILQATPLFNKDSIDKAIYNNGNYGNKEIRKDISIPESQFQFNAERITDNDVESIINDTDVVEEDELELVSIDDNKKLRLICLASATSNDPAVVSFADRYCGDKQWNRVAVNAATMLPTTITHGLISTTRMRALDMLRRFLNAKPNVQSALIFVNDPHRVEIIVKELLEMDVIAAPLHGDSSKDDRKEIIARIKDGRLRLVVTTELAARGLDIPELTHVINFELPTDAQHYVHRAGRCGRAGRQGLVMNFANPETKFVIRRFGKKLGVKVNDCEIRDGKVFLKMK